MDRALSMTLMRLSVCKHVQFSRLPSLMMQSYMEPCPTPHSQHGAPASSQGRFTCLRTSEMCVESIKSGLGMGHTSPRAAPQARAELYLAIWAANDHHSSSSESDMGGARIRAFQRRERFPERNGKVVALRRI